MVLVRGTMLEVKRLRIIALVLLMVPCLSEKEAIKVIWEIMAQEFEEYQKLEAGLNG